LVLAAALVFINSAASSQAVEPPVEVELSQGRLLGTSRLTFWGFEVYNASLWSEPGFKPSDMGQNRFALELRYLRSFKGADIAKRSIEEMRRIGDFSDAQAQRWLKIMQSAFPDVSAGDRITGIHRPGQGARFLFNGRVTADVTDVEFARLFFGIWLSEKTSEPKMRLSLLGLTDSGRTP
jgi:hypothetical protein